MKTAEIQHQFVDRRFADQDAVILEFPPQQKEEVFVSDEDSNACDPRAYHRFTGRISVEGGESSYTLNVPLDPTTKIVTTYLNGLCAFKKTSRGIGNATAELGVPSLRLAPVRGSDRSIKQDLMNPTGIHVSTVEAVYNHLSANKVVQDVIGKDALDLAHKRLAGHSYGGDVAVKYALAHPDEVEDLILIKSVGMEDARLFRHLGRLIPFGKLELVPFIKHSRDIEFSVWDGYRALKHIFGDPLQTLGEFGACMRVDNRSHIPTLQEHGIGVALISGSADNLVPAAPMEKLASTLVDYYEKLDTDHLGPQREPVKVAQAVIRASKVLEAKKLTKLQLA